MNISKRCGKYNGILTQQLRKIHYLHEWSWKQIPREEKEGSKGER